MLVLSIFVLFSLIQTISLNFINPPFSAYMFWDRLLENHKTSLNLEWKSLNEMSPHAARAVLAAEDQRFYQHMGVDWTEMKLAVEDGLEGKNMRGASTISMQAARNMFLWRNRSYLRKVLEAWYTLLLELFLSKNRILEIYLNIAEMGPGVYGVPAASQKYFGRPPSRLSKDQAARLAVILPSPRKWSPLRTTPYTSKRKRFILKHMRYIKLENWPG